MESWWQVVGVLLLMPTVAGACVAAVQIYLGGGVRGLPLAMVAALALAIYALNRLTDREEDRWNAPAGVRARERGGMVLLMVAGVALAAIAVALAAEGRLGAIYGMILLVGVLYSCPLVPWYRRGVGLTLVRFKAIPLVKNLAISATWAASVFLVPLLDGGAPSQIAPRFVLLAAGYALMTCLNSLFCDLRDAEGDRAAGVTTLATRLGSARSYRWVMVVTVAWVAYLSGIYASSDWLDRAHFLFLLGAAIGYPLIVGLARERLRLSRARVDLLVESSDLVFAAGVLALARLG